MLNPSSDLPAQPAPLTRGPLVVQSLRDGLQPHMLTYSCVCFSDDNDE